MRSLTAFALVLLSLAGAPPARAFWSDPAIGTGSATVATLSAPDVTAQSPSLSDQVAVHWTIPAVPAGMHATGFRVARRSSGVTANACGTTPSTPLARTATDCLDVGVPDGEYDYIVTLLTGPWTADGMTTTTTTVAADRTGPAVAMSGSNPTNALLAQRNGGNVLFFRTNAAGSINLVATLTDTGVGPALATFPTVPTSGWTHQTETVTVGVGSAPTVAYTSSPFTFSSGAGTPSPLAVTGTDARGNVGTASITVVGDGVAPTGGALRVNSVDATAVGSVSTATVAFAVTGRTDFVEAPTTSASGLGSSVLLRASAPLVSGTCGSYGVATALGSTLPVNQSGLPDGCYRYTLTGTDLVGNAASVSTTVRLDTSAPVNGALTVGTVDAVPGGVTTFSTSTTVSLSRTDFVDPESGMTSSVLTRRSATLSAGACGALGAATTLVGAPAQTGLTTGCYQYDLVGTNTLGLVASLQATVRVDTAAPTGGALTVNSVAATTAIPTSNNTTGTVAVSALTNYTDAASGIASSVLTRAFATMSAGVCGTYGQPIPVSGSPTFNVAGLATGCHRFTLTGTDAAGNSASIATIVKVDLSAPSGGSLAVNGVDASAAGTSSGASAATWNAVWALSDDSDSGIASASLTRATATYASGVCAAFGAATTLWSATTPTTGTTAQTGLTANRCYKYVLTTTNALGLSTSYTTTVMLDTTVPTGGAMTVNAVAASAAGSSSTNGTGSISLTVTTAWADTGSSIASTTLVRTQSTVSANACGTTFDTPVPVTFTLGTAMTDPGLTNGCYRYTLTGTNGVGLSASILSTVRVDTTGPVGGALNVNAVDASPAGTTSLANAAGYAIARTDWTDPETTVTSVLTRASATLSNGSCGAYGGATTIAGAPNQTGLATACYRYVLTGTNALVPPALTTTTVVMLDTTAPTSGAMTVNAVAASAAGSTSTNGTGSVSLTVTTAWADAHSLMASTALVRTQSTVSAGTCGTTFDTPVPITYTVGTALTDPGLANGCYRYTLTGTNGVGLSSSVLSTVRIDTTGPVGGALTVNGVDASASGTTSTATAAGYPISRTDWSDPETTVTSVLTRATATLANGTCAAFGSTTTLTGSPDQTGLATGCYRYVLTGTNALVPPAVTVTTTVMLDTSAPTSAFTVNGAAASAAGSTSTIAAGGTFSVSAFTAPADTQSGLATSTFTRVPGVSTAGVCGNFNASAAVTLTQGTQTQAGLANGCYQYVLSGTNNFGAVTTISSTVRVGP